MDKVKVLIVDDHPMVLEGMRSMLAQITFVEITGAVSNAYTALETLKKAAIDIVITDINMSGVSGTEATKAIRDLEMQHKRSSRIPIIALSGFINTEIKKDLLTNGFDAVLDKLAGPDEFTKLFKTLLP